MLSYRLLHIARRLNSGELLLLRTIYGALTRKDFQQQYVGLSQWACKIAILQGHKLTALVLKDEHALVEEELISGYENASTTASHQSVHETNARVTDLGIAFCKNIETYRAETGGVPQ